MQPLAIPCCVALTLACIPTVSAQEPDTKKPETLLLWPDGAPGALGDAAKDKPKLIIYHAAKAKTPRASIVICPGGGYGGLAMGHEGHQIAKWLNTLGMTGVILDYRHRGKGYGHPTPLGDAQRAVRIARFHAGDWNLDPNKIGILGFSAGGHLASSASVHFDKGHPDSKDPVDKQSCRPDFSVLCYPVIAFDEAFTHRGSQRNLLGKQPDPGLVRKMSSEKQVTAATPPAFLFHTTADRAVPVQNSLVYYMALTRHKVPCELHVFEKGRHGIGLGKGHAAEKWPELCRRWLVTRGVLKN